VEGEVMTMVERIGQLLDDAVGEVVPREVDPVGAVLRRARVARARRIAGTSVVAALMVIATAVVWTGRGDPPARLASPATGPAVVTVTNGVIHAGGVHLPIPKGWKVAAADQPLCSAADLVFINGTVPPMDPCPAGPARISVFGIAPQINAIIGRNETRELRLPGGQPAWVARAELEALRTGPESEITSLTVALPWAGARLGFVMPRGELTRILGTVYTDPVAATRLVLPTDAELAGATIRPVPGVYDRAWYGPPGKLVTGLAGLAEPVTGGCPEDVDLGIIELWTSTGMVAVVMIGCGRATSSLGGRVRVDDDSLRSLAGEMVVR
jgi:hypothetical protein